MSSTLLKFIGKVKFMFRISRDIRDMIKIGQKKPSRDILKKRCSENKQQTYRRTPMPKCDFNKVAKQLFQKICCIFSEYLFLRTPLEVASEKENISIISL